MFERVDSNSSLRDYLSQVKRGLEGAELSSPNDRTCSAHQNPEIQPNCIPYSDKSHSTKTSLQVNSDYKRRHIQI